MRGLGYGGEPNDNVKRVLVAGEAAKVEKAFGVLHVKWDNFIFLLEFFHFVLTRVFPIYEE